MRARKKHPLPLVGAARLCFSRVWRVERRRLRRACRWRCCRPHLEGTCGPDRVVPETPPYALGRGSRFANDTAAGWSTAVSSARNTIETIFCLRRNHIPFPLLNPPSLRGHQWATGGLEGTAMKRCAQCHGKLGLGVRSRNLWNGRWWAHVSFCSTRWEGLYELERYDTNEHSWRTVLARPNPQS